MLDAQPSPTTRIQFYFNNRGCMQSSGILGRPGWNIVNAVDLSGIFIN